MFLQHPYVQQVIHHPTDTAATVSLASSFAWVPALEQWETGLGLSALVLAVLLGIIRVIVAAVELKRKLEITTSVEVNVEKKDKK